MSFINELKKSGSSTKIAVSWIVTATTCLTVYALARRWAFNQRENTLLLKDKVMEEYGIERKLQQLRESASK